MKNKGLNEHAPAGPLTVDPTLAAERLAAPPRSQRFTELEALIAEEGSTCFANTPKASIPPRKAAPPTVRPYPSARLAGWKPLDPRKCLSCGATEVDIFPIYGTKKPGCCDRCRFNARIAVVRFLRAFARHASPETYALSTKTNEVA